MILVRRLLGDVLRELRLEQGRTLRDVSADARVSLGYISEIERGQKEASSECLRRHLSGARCAAVGHHGRRSAARSPARKSRAGLPRCRRQSRSLAEIRVVQRRHQRRRLNAQPLSVCTTSELWRAHDICPVPVVRLVQCLHESVDLRRHDDDHPAYLRAFGGERVHRPGRDVRDISWAEQLALVADQHLELPSTTQNASSPP